MFLNQRLLVVQFRKFILTIISLLLFPDDLLNLLHLSLVHLPNDKLLFASKGALRFSLDDLWFCQVSAIGELLG